jgi:hypothetical protein
MSYHASGPRRNSGAKFQKSSHEKKSKIKKNRSNAKYVEQEQAEQSLKEITEKTLASIDRLGNQTFALSPFSQYYDDWLVNLRRVVSEFESNPNVSADELFVKERTQIFLDVEAALAERRLAESTLSGGARELQEINHQLTDSDRDYAQQNRALSDKRNADVQRLSNKIRAIEDSVASQEAVKFGYFKFKARREAAEKIEQTRKQLAAAKEELEVVLQNFKVEQEKLHDNYQSRRQELTVQIERLHSELEKLETDTSVEVRKTYCNALACAVNALVQRMPSSG